MSEETLRYLISYLQENERDFLMDMPAEIDYQDLKKVIQRFFEDLP